MIELLVRLTASAGRSQELIQSLRSVMRGLQVEGVCQAAHCATDADDQNLVWYREEWPQIDDFERHVRSEPFARLLSVIETAATAPVIECRVISEVRGLDYLAAVRASR
jgi:quinol monooxygenase YgiN